MHQTQVLSRALNTHNYKKDVVEVGGSRDKTPSSILGRAQDSLYSSKTGLRRFFGGAKDDVVGPITDDQTEVLELQDVPADTPSVPAGPPEEASGHMGKVRRASMTTYTVNIGATGAQVQREVRRLAGLMPPAFGRPTGGGTGAGDGQLMSATSFDAVEEMNASNASNGVASGRSGAESDREFDDDDADYSFQGGGGAGSRFGGAAPTITGRGPPVKAAFSNPSNALPFDGTSYIGRQGSYDDVVGTFSGPSTAAVAPVSITAGAAPCGTAAGCRSSLELLDISSTGPSSGNLHFPAGALDARPPLVAQRLSRLGSSSQLAGSTGLGISMMATSAAAAAAAGAQLGLMRDRKSASRHGTADGYSSSPGPLSPSTPAGPGGPAGAGSGGGAAAASAGASPTSVLRLPTLQQLGPAQQSSFVSNNADSRPNSSRALLRGAGSRRGSMDMFGGGISDVSGGLFGSFRHGVSGLNGGGSSNVAPNNGGGSGGGGGAGGGGGGGGGAGGGRWFQQDADDVDDMLAGGTEEVLQRLMLAGQGGGSSGGLAGGYRSGEGDVDRSLTLPRLPTSEVGPVDRATAHLNELRRVQATVDDQLARERQAIASGKVRRASVLEDVAGQHQPRWQVTYNPDAQVTHAKLGMVDPSRRSELDKAHLAKFAKDQKGSGGGGVGAATVSPVVARARRLSTVITA